jgi:hypothetical protein
MNKRRTRLAFAGLAFALLFHPPARAEEGKSKRLDLYGFAMLDMGYQGGTSDPNWFDVLRPTKLPSFENEFGKDGHFFAGVRQSRLGVKGFIPTTESEIKTIFEFELFGVGPDEGQTTFRLRHAWGEYKKWGAGQTWSPFMDPDVFPNSIEYWGPSGMVFFRNVQLRFMPMQGKNEFFVALERPGASGDPGVFSTSSELTGVQGRFPLPDLSAHYRRTADWGHFQVAGILRKIKWDDLTPTPTDISGSATGWGINLSSNVKIAGDTLRLQFVYGEGIANYMNDATSDVGATGGVDVGEALPVTGIVAFYDCNWSSIWTSSFGYSMIDIDNSAAQDTTAFKRGQYALVNLLNNKVENLMWGFEVQWGKRENFMDGLANINGDISQGSDDLRVQFSARYKFGHSWGGQS